MSQPQANIYRPIQAVQSSSYDVKHHGAVNGVTGSCHELCYSIHEKETGILIDCGLFQGAETQEHLEQQYTSHDSLLDDTIPFDITHINALIVTHVHIDHVGRIPYLLAKGFKGPIYCSEASATLLPLVLEDAIKIGFTRNHTYVQKFISHVKQLIKPLAFNTWHVIDEKLKIKLKPAGHILGSAYVVCRLKQPMATRLFLPFKNKDILFSGDLGAPHSPILKAPKPPVGCDVLVMESTYGDKNHESRRHRRQRLKAMIEKALQNEGTIIIPAFSIGRTQELLYELEEIIHQETVGANLLSKTSQAGLYEPVLAGDTDSKVNWQNLEIILDSPLAAKFTHAIGQLKHCWGKEALRKVRMGRKPLTFENVTTIDTHKTHLQTVEYLANNKRPAIVIAASGMCNGGRVMNYLKAMLGDPRHDVLFVGYQAFGTIGRLIQKYGPTGGYVTISGAKITIKAGIHTIGGYSAHAGQTDLLNFVKRIWRKPSEIRLIHGDDRAKQALKVKLQAMYPKTNIWVPTK